MKSAIVTGANGFIGKALVRHLLQQGVEVYAVVRNREKMDDFVACSKLHIIEAEFADYLNLAEKIRETKQDVFYHLAWEGVFGAPFKDYRLQLDNARYTCDAMMSAVDLKCEKFVLVGTVNELEVKKYLETDECSPRFTCIYATAKLASGMICKTLASNHGLDFNEALLAMVYGEGDQSEMLPKVLVKSFLGGVRPKLVEGNDLYDWIYIDDVVNGLRAIGEKGKRFKTYYVGHKELKKFRQIVEEVRDTLSPDMQLVFGEFPDNSMIDYSKIDLGALEQDTGFAPSTNFSDNIRKTAAWVKTLNL